MWSEVFTHDFENGEKVAIILLDTQGIFDTHSTMQECTTIFGLTTMLSSVQLFNVKEQIQEDDLQHLDLFTGYANYMFNQTNEKAFQKLLFVIRNWPFPLDVAYGDGKKVIDEIMANDADRSSEMQELRERIISSYDEIGAFLLPLLPHPGMTVAHEKNFTGDLEQIDPQFIKYVEQLVPGICAPKNLIIKKINGQKVRAHNLVQYFEDYLDILNKMPPPETIYEVNLLLKLRPPTSEVKYFLNNTFQNRPQLKRASRYCTMTFKTITRN